MLLLLSYSFSQRCAPMRSSILRKIANALHVFDITEIVRESDKMILWMLGVIKFESFGINGCMVFVRIEPVD